MRIAQSSFFVALMFGLLAWSLPADTQQPAKMPLIGILSDYSASFAVKATAPFAQGLRDLGYVEGQNVAFEYRHGDGNDAILPRLAGELVGLQPDVILAVGTPAARAAKGATQTIPIVFARIADAIGLGLVSSLARPGGNLTGVSLLSIETGAKRLELLLTAVPDAKRVAALWDPSFPAAALEFREIEGAARSLNVELVSAEVRGLNDLEPAFLAMVQQRAGALIVLVEGPLSEHRQRIVDLTIKARLPSMFAARTAGGLMSYGPNFPEMYRRAATYVDKILKGAKPADLPVEQPTKFELVINLKTAKLVGLTIPHALLLRADEVIE